jgi:hypothetical protein
MAVAFAFWELTRNEGFHATIAKSWRNIQSCVLPYKASKAQKAWPHGEEFKQVYKESNFFVKDINQVIVHKAGCISPCFSAIYCLPLPCSML